MVASFDDVDALLARADQRELGRVLGTAQPEAIVLALEDRLALVVLQLLLDRRQLGRKVRVGATVHGADRQHQIVREANRLDTLLVLRAVAL